MIGPIALALGMLAAATPAEDAWPGAAWTEATPAEAGLDPARLESVREYALTGGGSGVIVRGGRRVLAWGDQGATYDLKSSTKAIGLTALGLALGDGLVRLDDPAAKYVPEIGTPPEANRATGWLDQITLRHLATQTAGFAKPGGFEPLLFRPGTEWHYSDGGPNWLADALTRATGRDLDALLFERVWEPIGIARNQLVWRANAYRPKALDGIPRREFGSGIRASVDAMARIGLLYRRGGRWRDRQLLPPEFVAQVGHPDPAARGLPVHEPQTYGRASDHYGLLWWNNADGTLAGVPRDASWTWGLYDSLIVVIPSLDLVVARAGQGWARREGADHYDVLKPFLQPLCAAVVAASPGPGAPVPPSRAVVGLDWAPADAVRRAAPGSDNWPCTWADDDALYTAYGDGRGFAPFVPRKLSLGLARVEGPPERFVGANVSAPTLERTGDGPRGPKASGLIAVDGMLYLWARNLNNARLAWSADRGASWTWADWRLETSFGCPTFVNFGKDHAGAPDDFVYVISPDGDSAYEPADAMVLARAPRGRLRERDAWQVFAGKRGDSPSWSEDFAQRVPILSDPGRCGRSGVSYVPAPGRYLLVSVLPAEPESGRRGLAIYDAPAPWGPWTAVRYDRPWDLDPGESASLPTKWIAPDGTSAALVFSGADSFRVRGVRLVQPGG